MLDEMSGTKLRIFEAAADLFSKEGYHSISMRQIADSIGLKAASIYNHFNSKEAILMAIYQYFDENMEKNAPNLDELLKDVETEHPHDILRKLTMVFPRDILPLMSKCMLVTSAMARYDPIAKKTIVKNLIDMTGRYVRPIFKKLIELDKVEPLDVESFILVLSNYSFSSANRFYLSEETTIRDEEWLAGLELIYNILKVK